MNERSEVFFSWNWEDDQRTAYVNIYSTIDGNTSRNTIAEGMTPGQAAHLVETLTNYLPFLRAENLM